MSQKQQYTQSRRVQSAQEALDALDAQAPGEYRSGWQEQLAGIMEQILSRQPFSYSLNGDALYRQYKDQAVQAGQQAMENSTALAAARTGGYGNSYAQSVGQQAYQRELQTLGDKIPELYALALEQYDRQGNALERSYQLLRQQEAADYSRYRDGVSDWQKSRQDAYNRYNQERTQDYTRYRDEVEDNYRESRDEKNDAYKAARDSAEDDYRARRDTVQDAQWQAEFEEAKRRYDQEWALRNAPKASYSGSGGGTGSAGKAKTVKSTASLKSNKKSSPQTAGGGTGSRAPGLSSSRAERITLH